MSGVNITQPLAPFHDRMLLDACYTYDMKSAINELIDLIHLIERESPARDLWSDHAFVDRHVIPLYHKLLSIRFEVSEGSSAVARQESCRVGVLLYITGIRHGFGLHLSTDVYIDKLKRTIKYLCYSEFEKAQLFQLWLVVIGGIQSLKHKDHNWYLSAIVDLIVRLKYTSWEEVMISVRDILWVEGSFQVECEKFHTEVSLMLDNSFAYSFL
jgi:hypothetical protein